MSDRHNSAPEKGPGENPRLRDEKDARQFEGTRSTGDQIGGQSSHSEKEQRGAVNGLPEDDEQGWEEQEAFKGASEGGDDRELDERLSDDQEQ